MEALCNLLFELSNEDRLGILLELEKGPRNLTQTAKNLDFTAQGTSRNVARLMQISLVERNLDGDYVLTPLGENALRLLAPFEFLSRERDYFLNHSTKWLPPSFVSRLGELRESERHSELLDVVADISRERRASKEYEWFISPGRMSSPRDAYDSIEQLKRGVKLRIIEPMYYTPPDNVMRETPREHLEFFEDQWRKGNIQARHLDEVRVRMYMTESEVAILALPKREGEVDVLGFHSRDPVFHGWCRDLYEYYWGQAKQLMWFWTQGRPRGEDRRR